MLSLKVKESSLILFRLEDRVPYNFVSSVVYEYTCGRFNSSCYDETGRHLKVRAGEHIGITYRRRPKESSIRDHLLKCDNNPSLDKFTILAHRVKSIDLKLKKVF